ncbi:MAG: CDP-alcohol phosphatidyltransferase family protein [Wenzhouxiangellaceae bacterium]|nr:CDP-alcohol phosphatidyltransferase family protein [Wenzhouxiangellaceae bacterium]
MSNQTAAEAGRGAAGPRRAAPVGLIVGAADVALWHVPGNERLLRLLRAAGVARRDIARVADHKELSAWSERVEPDRPVLIVNAGYLFEPRTLAPLAGGREPLVLVVPVDDDAPGRIAAARVAAEDAAPVARAVLDDQPVASLDAPLRNAVLGAGKLGGHDARLRRVGAPLLERLSADRVEELESELYGNAYKGVTDAITKWLWPRPAALLVRACARLGLTPNAVTGASLLLVIFAGWMFYQGAWLPGLLAAWIMTLLDTVDGKLARVTVQSSRVGDVFDHGIDLVHPPFWYLAWALGTNGTGVVQGLDPGELALLIFAPYIGGRLIELAFGLACGGSLFTFRPFDSWFRLIAARRNPNLVILSASVVVGRPDVGVLGVIVWSILSTLIEAVRLADGIRARLRTGRPLVAWLGREPCRRRHPVSFRIFSTTRGAYGRR